MALLGASSNHDFAGTIGRANDRRVHLLAQHADDLPIAPRKVARLRPPRVSQTVEQILRDEARPLRCRELLDICEAAGLGSLGRTSVKAALADLASSPTSPVERVSYGLYEARTKSPHQDQVDTNQ